MGECLAERNTRSEIRDDGRFCINRKEPLNVQHEMIFGITLIIKEHYAL